MERLAMGQAGLRELVDEDLDLCRDHRLPATVRPLGRDRFIGGAAVQLVDDEPLPLAPRRRLPPGLLRGHGRTEHVRDDLVDCGDGCWCQVPGSSQVLIHLLPAPRPCQHHGDAGPGQEPAQRQPREGGVEALGQRPQSLDHEVPSLELRPLEPVDLPRKIYWFQGPEFERRHLVIERLRPLAEGLDTTLPGLALGWLLSRPGVTVVLAGARSREQVDQNLAAPRHLAPATVAAIDEIVADVFRPAVATEQARRQAATWGERERFIVDKLDGRTAYEAIAAEWTDRGGKPMIAAQIKVFVDQLAEAGLAHG